MSSSCAEAVTSEENAWFRIARELLEQADIRVNGSRPWDIQVHHADFFKRVIQEGSLGLGESYMDGWWTCERLDMFFQRALRHHLDHQLPHHFKDTLRIAAARLTNLQSKKRAWQVGRAHYDLGNDLFSLMLDLICRKLQLEPGMSLLDIGCGWGGLAEFAARRYGVSVYGVTISQEQQKMAQQRCAGLDVTIQLQDYRDLEQQFDRIVSVGMFEHVGPKNYATYFRVVNRNLKPGGLFLLHTIGAVGPDMRVDPWVDN